MAVAVTMLLTVISQRQALAAHSSPTHSATTSYTLTSRVQLTQNGIQPQVALRQDGSIGIVYRTNVYRQRSDVAYIETDGLTTTLQPVRLSSTTSGLADAAAGSIAELGGTMHAVWDENGAQGGDSKVTYSRGNGNNWTTPAPISDYRQYGPLLATTSGGLDLIWFAGATHPPYPYALRSTDGGGTWSTPQQLTNDGIGYAGGGDQLISYNGGQDLALVWTENFGDGAIIRLHQRTQGVWQPYTYASDPALIGANAPSVAVANGNIYVSYCAWTASGGVRNAYVAVQPLAGGTWGYQQLTQFTDPTQNFCHNTSVAFDAATGEILVAAAANNGTHQDVYLSVSEAGGAFSAAANITNLSGTEVAENPTLLLVNGAWMMVWDGYDANDQNFPYGIMVGQLASASAATPTPTGSPAPATPTGILPSPQPTQPTSTPTALPSPTPAPCQFSDISGDPYRDQIVALCQAGVVSGVDGTHFDPAGSATRAQFVKMLMLGFGIPRATPAIPYFQDDAPNQWYFPYIEGAHQQYLVTGYDATWCVAAQIGYPCYRPNKAISRAELARMVVDATGVVPFTPATPTYFDVPPSHWAYQYIETAAYYQLMGGWTYRHFAPNQSARRDEMAHTLYQALHICLAADGSVSNTCARIKRAKSQP